WRDDLFMTSFDSSDRTFTSLRRDGTGHRRDELLTGPWTLALVDAGIAGSLIAVPFCMGGRTPAGQLLFVGIAFWTALAWTIHQALGNGDRGWRNTVAFFPIAAALGLVLLQLIPLSPSLLEKLSPRVYETLPLWKPGAPGQATLGVWRTLSMTPEATRQSLLLLVSGALLFAVTLQRVERVGDVERIVRCLAVAASLMAIFGIVQFLTSNGKFFWFLEHPYSNTSDCVKGSFTNRNHFAQFVALGFGALLWWAFGAGPESRGRSAGAERFGMRDRGLSLQGVFKSLLVPICALAVLMSFSRGGAIALLVSAVTSLYLLLAGGKLSRQAFAGLTGLGLFVCLGLSIYGYDALAQRFESVASLTSLDSRSRLWSAACEGFGDHLACGTGLSSHGSVYPMYLEPDPETDAGVYYTHAENGYVQLALETGATGLALALTVAAICLFGCAAALTGTCDTRTVLCYAAIVPALLANLVHSAMDYVWYVPGCMSVVAILGACACRLYQLERRPAAAGSRLFSLPRFAWAGIAVLLVAFAGSSLPGFWRAFEADGSWNRYLFLKRSLVELNQRTAYDDIPAESESRKQILTGMIKELSGVLDLRPDWEFAHVCKAQTHRDLFHEMQSTAENEFDLRMIRETVLANFDSVEAAREWLPRGVGEHCIHLDAALQHAHRAAELGPLEGETYLLLAELSFLEERPVPGRSAYLDQAFRVRPYDGTILFEIGSELTLAGRFEESLTYLKRSFRCGREHQQRLIQALAGNVPAAEFLRTFRPDADALQLMVGHYRRPELAGELECVLAAHAVACEAKARSLENREAANYLVRAAGSHERLHNPVRQRDCLERAVAADSINFDVRLALGRACLTLEDFEEAARQLRWCTQRKPGHPAAERLLEQAVGEGIASAHRPATAEGAGRFSSSLRR
ncbi:MAG: O-antigen ligase family protein, partial [Thermoguttaceae bacterium]